MGRRDRIMQWVRDIPYHYELHALDGKVLCRVALKGQAERAAADWPSGPPPQVVRVRGLHPDTFFSVGLLILFPAVTIGTVLLCKLMMALAVLALVGIGLVLILRMSEGNDGPDMEDAENDDWPFSAAQRASIEAALDEAVEAEIGRRYPQACPTCGTPVPVRPGRVARAAAPDPERERPPPLTP
jgi:hypothetical protein